MHRFLLSILFCLLVTPSWAAVVCGDEVSTNASPPADPQTLAITPAAGGILIVHVGIRETDAENGVVSGVTSDAGGTFTLYGNNVETGGVDVLSYIFYSTNYSTSAQTLSIDYGTSTPSQSVVAAYVCTGVRLSNPWLGSATTGEVSDTSISLSVPCQVGALAVDAVAVGSIDAGAPTEGANQTSLYNIAAGAANFDAAGSTEAGASTNTMSWSAGTTEIWGSVGGCLVQQPSGSSPIYLD